MCLFYINGIVGMYDTGTSTYEQKHGKNLLFGDTSTRWRLSTAHRTKETAKNLLSLHTTHVEVIRQRQRETENGKQVMFFGSSSSFELEMKR